MFNYGSQVNPALGRSDFSGILQGQMQANQGMMQGAQAQGQAYANIGQSLAKGIEQYSQNQDFIGKAIGQFSGVQKTFGDEFNNSVAKAPAEVADAIKKLSEGKTLGTKDAAMLATFANSFKDAKNEESMIRQRNVQTALAQQEAAIAQKNSAALARTLAYFNPPEDIKGQIMAGRKFEDFGSPAPTVSPTTQQFTSKFLQEGGELGRGNGMEHLVKGFQMLAPADRSNEYNSASAAAAAISSLPKSPGMNWTAKYNEKTGKFYTEQVNAPVGPTVNIGDQMDKSVFDSELKKYEVAQSAVDNISKLHRIGEMLKSGSVFTGTGANQKLSIAKLLSAAGLGNFDNEIVATETYKSMIGKSVIPGLQALGRNPTDKDLKFMLDVSGASTDLNKDTLIEINRIADEAGKELALKHNQRVQRVFGGDTPAEKRARTALLVDLPEITSTTKGYPSMPTTATPQSTTGVTKQWVRDSSGKLILK